ncbi:FxDxF family PEP-CTERM protein [Aquincola sp. MAHUQ-54]|uniref:FxDxF family PEP-CTERM protein n=1 Tax=Aquincola agrisoli TaxID=3119538 RepID=A0AAW9QP61_9BURK
MKRSAVVLASVLALAGAAANAATFNPWGVHDSFESFSFSYPTQTTFEDRINFTLSGASDLWSVAVSNEAPLVLNITGGSLELFRASDNAAVFNSPLTFDSTSTSVLTSSLAAGDYYYVVKGAVTGSVAGTYTITSVVTAVPEPETYALLLGGLGVIGFVARRRKAD